MMVAGDASTVCIACTLILSLLEEKAVEDSGPQQQRELCELLGGGNACATAPYALPSPDSLCQDLKLCTGYTQCLLFPNGTWPPPANVTAAHGGRGASSSELYDLVDGGGDLTSLREAVVAASEHLPPSMLFAPAKEVASAAAQAQAAVMAQGTKQLDPCGLNITCLVYRIGTLHLPLLDDDGDFFAPVGGGELGGLLGRGARGSHWRGGDCNDKNAAIYPGRRAVAGDIVEDTNCNGIKGVDPTTKMPYEKLWCSGAHEPKGIVVLGDSASAHFHLPPTWLSAVNFSLAEILADAPLDVADELDIPECSWTTGHAENASVAMARCPKVWRQPGSGDVPALPNTSLPLKSIYGRMNQRNKCNHRDFQNLGVNGARVGAIAPKEDGSGIVIGMSRDKEDDVPLIVFHPLIGNDVCNGHPGMGSMTTVAKFGAAVNKTLDHLETVLPRGSTVILIGLAQATLLYHHC